MSEAAVELAELLTELRATEGKFARAKLLMDGGRLLKGMSTEERIRVAYSLGVDNIGDLLLKADREQLTDDDIAALVDRAEALDPLEIGALIRELDDPSLRGDAAKGLVDELLPAPPPQVAEPFPDTDDPPLDHPPVEPHPDDGHPLDGYLADADDPASGDPTEAEPEIVAVEVPAEPVERPEPEPRPEAPPTPAADPQPVTGPEPAPRPAPERRPVDETSALAAAVAAVPSAVGQLRVLRTHTVDAADLSTGQLRHLIRTFPVGWRRRRAVTTLLAAGVPASFVGALALLEELPSEADWVWAASTLVRERDLAVEALQRLLASAPSEHARRRIAMRAR